MLPTAPFGSYRYLHHGNILCLLIYAATNPVAAAATVSHIPLEADAAALLEHMAGVVGETLLALHGTCTVRQPCDPVHFLVRVVAARTARCAVRAHFRTTGMASGSRGPELSSSSVVQFPIIGCKIFLHNRPDERTTKN